MAFICDRKLEHSSFVSATFERSSILNLHLHPKNIAPRALEEVPLLWIAMMVQRLEQALVINQRPLQNQVAPHAENPVPHHARAVRRVRLVKHAPPPVRDGAAATLHTALANFPPLRHAQLVCDRVKRIFTSHVRAKD